MKVFNSFFNSFIGLCTLICVFSAISCTIAFYAIQTSFFQEFTSVSTKRTYAKALVEIGKINNGEKRKRPYIYKAVQFLEVTSSTSWSILTRAYSSILLSTSNFVSWTSDTFVHYLQVTKESWRSFLYDYEIILEGINFSSKQELIASLPRDRSFLWWHGNNEKVEAVLRKYRFIAGAKLTKCGLFSFRCFKLGIEEHKPSFIALPGGKSWLVSDKGIMLFPLRSIPSSVNTKALATLPVIRGLDIGGLSPRMLSSRVMYIDERVKEIQSETDRRVRGVSFQPNAELKVFLEGVSFPVVFGESLEEKSLFSREVKRLKKLLVGLSSRLDEISSVDLGFNKLAVVKLK